MRFFFITSLVCLQIASLEALPIFESAQGEVKQEIVGYELIVQASDKSILNFPNFDIQKYETVKIITDNPQDRVLIKIKEGSHIYGQLISSATTYIVAEEKLTFHSSSSVDIYFAYTISGRLSEEDFLQGHNHFTDPSNDIEICGLFSADELVFFGRKIVQSGTVWCGGPDDILMCDEGCVLYATCPSLTLGKEENDFLIGTLQDQVQDIEFVQHHHGSTKAKNIRVAAAEKSFIHIEGKIDANSYRSGREGGKIHIEGQFIHLSRAIIEACGPSGGGKIWVGVAKENDIFIPTAHYLDATNHFSCRALKNGNGGEMIFGAKKYLAFNGSFSISPGPQGGKSGYIKTVCPHYCHIENLH